MKREKINAEERRTEDREKSVKKPVQRILFDQLEALGETIDKKNQHRDPETEQNPVHPGAGEI